MQETNENKVWQEASGRDVAALLDPRPVIIVGSVGRRDEVGFATIIWAMPVSHDPALVAFSLRARSHTMSCIQTSGHFSLNVLPPTPEGVFLCEQVGTRTGFQFNKNVVVKHRIESIEHAFSPMNIDIQQTEGSEDAPVDDGDKLTIKELFKKNSIIAQHLSKKHASAKAGENGGRGGQSRTASDGHRKQTNEARSATANATNTATATSEGIVRAKVPVVEMATSYLLCSTQSITETGDHLLVVGKVERAYTTAPRDAQGLLTPKDALLCVQHGCYGKVELLNNEPK